MFVFGHVVCYHVFHWLSKDRLAHAVTIGDLCSGGFYVTNLFRCWSLEFRQGQTASKTPPCRTDAGLLWQCLAVWQDSHPVTAMLDGMCKPGH